MSDNVSDLDLDAFYGDFYLLNFASNLIVTEYLLSCLHQFFRRFSK